MYLGQQISPFAKKAFNTLGKTPAGNEHGNQDLLSHTNLYQNHYHNLVLECLDIYKLVLYFFMKCKQGAIWP